MNQKTISIIVIALIVVALIVFFFMQKKDGGDSINNVRGGDNQEEVADNSKGMGTLANLFSRGDDMTCTVAYTAEGYSTQGVMFISGGKMRGDFTVQTDGQTMESHMIQDGTYGYSWGVTPMGNMGMKFALTDEDDAADTSARSDEATRYGIDLSQSAEYDCKPWRVDGSKFVPPSDVEFMDMEAQLKATTGQGAGSQCGMCAQISDADAKAQCLAALGCN